ncbi:MAG: DUF3034 family protein [Phycisphaerae bacterium]
MKKLFSRAVVYLGVLTVLDFSLYAGVPFNNLEGVGGAAFNPFAYTAGNDFEKDDTQPQKKSLADIFSKPQIGTWYVHLGDVGIDWTTIGVAGTLFKRLEVSYGYESISVANAKNIYKNNFGLKYLIVKETDVIPAISFGTVFKHTSFSTPPGVDKSGVDFYLVATKFIKALPVPVLLSGGFLSTKGQTLGVLGFNNDRDEVFFGNIDIMPFENIAVGFEYRQGAKYKTWKDADYWNTHLAWFVNKNLTLIAAYVNTGNHRSSSKVGLGGGVVVSLQYAF